jgi:hypothetical protein
MKPLPWGTTAACCRTNRSNTLGGKQTQLGHVLEIPEDVPEECFVARIVGEQLRETMVQPPLPILDRARAMHNLIQHAEYQAMLRGLEVSYFEAIEGGDIVIYWEASARA